jgi:Acetyltransferase (GNAT) domain
MRKPEIAFELFRRVDGFGFATEAGRAVVGVAAATGRGRLWSTVRAWNQPSLRVLEKLGFVRTPRVDADPDRGDTLWLTHDLGAHRWTRPSRGAQTGSRHFNLKIETPSSETLLPVAGISPRGVTNGAIPEIIFRTGCTRHSQAEEFGESTIGKRRYKRAAECASLLSACALAPGIATSASRPRRRYVSR